MRIGLNTSIVGGSLINPFAAYAIGGQTPQTLADFEADKYASANKNLGPELVTNGTFDTDSDWRLGTGWSISGGVAVATNVAGQYLDQSLDIEAGRVYRVQFNVTRNSGNYSVRLGGAEIVSAVITNLDFDGYVVAGGSTLKIDFRGFSFNGTVDNISVREVVSYSPASTTAESLLTHTRSGNAVQVADDGTLQWAGHNLLTYSEDFSNAAWTKGGTATLALDATGPDGQANSAVTLIDSGAGGTNQVFVNTNVTVSTSTTYTASIFAKADQLSWIAIGAFNFTTPANGRVWFDLSSGTVGTENAGLSGSIEDYGNGWYRCAITFTTDAADTTGLVSYQAADADNDFTVDLDGTSSILIYGAHFYRSDLGGMADIPTSYRGLSSSSTYLPTTTAARYLPRVDNHLYNANTAKWNAHNLVTYSEDFTDESWIRQVSATVVADTEIAPDGTLTADTLNLGSSTSSAVYKQNIPTTGEQTFSVWAKCASGTETFRFISFNGTDGQVNGPDLTATTEWQRFSFTYSPTATNNWYISNSSSGGEKSILIWGAHLYRSDLNGVVANSGNSVSGLYVPTEGTAVEPTLASVSFDKRCLVEPQSTNLVTYSEDFTDASWLKTVGSAFSVTANSESAPSGEATADTLTEDTSTNLRGIYKVTNAVSANWTASIFIKQKTAGRYLQIRPYGIGTGVAYATFSPSDGSVYESGGTNLVSAEAESFGNGWYRISLTCSSALGSGDGVQFLLSDGTSGEAPSYTGDGTSGIFIWGAQVEESPVPTSYIPTAGATVTRPADALSIDSTLLPYDSTAMTIALDGEMTYADTGTAVEVYWIRWVADANNGLFIYNSTAGANVGQPTFQQEEANILDGVVGASDAYSPGTNVPFNIASRNTSSDINGAVDGTALTANTTVTALPNLSATDFQIATTGVINIKSLRILGGYGATDAELEAATS